MYQERWGSAPIAPNLYNIFQSYSQTIICNFRGSSLLCFLPKIKLPIWLLLPRISFKMAIKLKGVWGLWCNGIVSKEEPDSITWLCSQSLDLMLQKKWFNNKHNWTSAGLPPASPGPWPPARAYIKLLAIKRLSHSPCLPWHLCQTKLWWLTHLLRQSLNQHLCLFSFGHFSFISTCSKAERWNVHCLSFKSLKKET